MQEVVETVYAPDNKRRVTIFKRANGSYGLEWEVYSDDPYELCWIPTPKFVSICDGLDIARREARGRLGLPDDA